MREKMSARHTNAAGKTTCHTHREHVRNTRTPPQSSTEQGSSAGMQCGYNGRGLPT